MKKIVGDFELEVWEPYPVHIIIRHGLGEIRFSHRDLADLKHMLAVATHEATMKLAVSDRHEIIG